MLKIMNCVYRTLEHICVQYVKPHRTNLALVLDTYKMIAVKWKMNSFECISNKLNLVSNSNWEQTTNERCKYFLIRFVSVNTMYLADVNIFNINMMNIMAKKHKETLIAVLPIE